MNKLLLSAPAVDRSTWLSIPYSAFNLAGKDIIYPIVNV